MGIDLNKHSEKLADGEDGLRGGDYCSPGKYRFLIQDAELSATNSGDEMWKLQCDVVASNQKDQDGKQANLTFFCADGQYEGNEARLLLLCLATGIATMDGLKKLAAAGEAFTPDLKAAIGREFCCELVKQKNNDFLRIKGKNIWAITDAAAKDIPNCGPGAQPIGGAGAGKDGELAGAF